MFERSFVTSVQVEADTEVVWEVLSDLRSYEEWNPMIRRASGELAPGSVLRVHFEPQGTRGHDFRPRITVVDPPRELRWTAFLRLPGVFDFEHYWELEPAAGGGTKLRHGLVLRGLLAPLLWNYMERTSRAPFEAMNLAHKERAEKLARERGGGSG